MGRAAGTASPEGPRLSRSSSSPPDLLSRPVAGRTAGCALNGPLRPRIDPDTGRQATQRYCELGRKTGKRSSGELPDPGGALSGLDRESKKVPHFTYTSQLRLEFPKTVAREVQPLAVEHPRLGVLFGQPGLEGLVAFGAPPSGAGWSPSSSRRSAAPGGLRTRPPSRPEEPRYQCSLRMERHI